MPFKKLIEPLKETINRLGFEAALPFQKKSLPKIKSGVNLFAMGPESSGKTTTLILSVIQKLKGEAFEDAPRALIIVRNKQEALKLQQAFNAYTSLTSLRVYSAYEEHSIDAQRDEIYVGVDILIATPKRLNKLFLLNSINLSQLKIFIVEDAEFVAETHCLQDINRIYESIDRCQYVIFGKRLDSKLKRFENSFMYNAQTVEIK